MKKNMAKIYISKEALETVENLRSKSYYDRIEDSIDIEKPGFTLHPAISCEALSDGVKPALSINTNKIDFYRDYVQFPRELRGCIFEKAPNLPEKYTENIKYWGDRKVAPPDNTDAIYFQNHLNAYLIQPPNSDDDNKDNITMDALVSEGVVVHIKDLGELIAVNKLEPDQFIEIGIPIDPEVFGDKSTDSKIYNTSHEYAVENVPMEKIYLKMSDVLASPDCQNVYINILRYELMDYGYYY
jgi:hypothetical protein